MLDTPKFGWVNIHAGTKYLGCASYLTDVPIELLDSMIQYFKSENVLNYSIEFDAEGYSFGLIEVNERLFLFDTASMEENTYNFEMIDPEDLNLESYAHAKTTLKQLAKELISDIKENFRDWLYWTYDCETMGLKEKKERKTELNKKIKELNELIKTA